MKLVFANMDSKTALHVARQKIICLITEVT